jgi:hypothetical protein
MKKAHQNNTNSFEELSFKEQAQSINISKVNHSAFFPEPALRTRAGRREPL